MDDVIGKSSRFRLLSSYCTCFDVSLLLMFRKQQEQANESCILYTFILAAVGCMHLRATSI